MTISETIKADFGLDVLIQSGNGTRAEPFVLEPCTAEVATAAQLNFLKGLGLGRREIWRLKAVENIRTQSANVQKVTIETVSFTDTQVISERRSYYYDLCNVDGIPDVANPPPIWFNKQVGIAAPPQIGWLHFDKQIDHSRGTGELNTSLQYSGLGSKLALYFNKNPNTLPGEPPAERMGAEFNFSCGDVVRVNPDAEAPWPPFEFGPFLGTFFLIDQQLSLVAVTCRGDYFIKIRHTFFDDPKMRELMQQTTDELIDIATRKNYWN